jgi:hypothetical protein
VEVRPWIFAQGYADGDSTRSGVSTSVGAPGARWTFTKRGIRSTFSLPGTGISYTEFRRYGQHTPPPRTDTPAWAPWLVLLIVGMALVYWLH